MKKISIIVLGLAIFLCGCATMKSREDEIEGVKVKRMEVKVYVNGDFKGYIPLKIQFEPYQLYQVVMKRGGYLDSVYEIYTIVSERWLKLDVLAGVCPVIVDEDGGLWMTLDQDKRNVVFEDGKAQKYNKNAK